MDVVKSWSVENLYNTHQRMFGPAKKEIVFNNTRKSLFQQKWICKKFAKGYHADWIRNKIFQTWYLPQALPVYVPSHNKSFSPMDTEKIQRARKSQNQSSFMNEDERAVQTEHNQAPSNIPTGTMMFAEVERRLDCLLFRSLYADSIYAARHAIISGNVYLNGQKVRQSFITRL